MTLHVGTPGRPPGPRRPADVRPGGDRVYGLSLPTAEDARAGLLEAFGDDPAAADRLWSELLAAAGLTGTETGPDAVERLVAAFTGHRDPVVVLCGRALRIRLSTYTHLLAAHRSMTQPRTTEDQA